MPTRDYPTAGVTVHWDSEVCIHSGMCVRSLPEVFRPAERPWIRVEGADAQRIVTAVLACPSGALRHTRTGDATTEPESTDQTEESDVTGPAEEFTGVSVTVSADGPYEVLGPVRIVAADGVTIKEGEKVWLCRCGQSAAKPFCDGTHRKVGFTDSGLGAKREKGAGTGQ